jgi:hypothetical protein
LPSLSNTQQREILAAAAPDYAGLYWYAEAQLPVRLRQDRFSDGYFPGAYPDRWIPVIPVPPDVRASREAVEFLCSIFWAYQPLFEFAPMLTSIDKLKATGAKWYVWGSLDVICPGCAAVGWDSCECGPVVKVADFGGGIMDVNEIRLDIQRYV